MDWSQIPDLGAVILLACAFASIARQGRTRVSRLWLTGWAMIALHFAAFIFLPLPGFLGDAAAFVGLGALADAGILFMYSTIPYYDQPSNRWMLAGLLFSINLYVSLLSINPLWAWALTPAALLVGFIPIVLSLSALPAFSHPIRWSLVSLFTSLAIFLLLVQHRGTTGPDLALNGVLFTVYAGCCIHFGYTYRRASAGALISIVGFGTWALVFVVGPLLAAYAPSVHVESEVWNLPKYLVAVGMILLMLEDQIEHNKYLALHDELTGLPNRRLYLDRLSVAIDRAQRLGSTMSLLVIDLDGFKAVNDSFGHHVGDVVLRKVAASFDKRVRRCDTVARTGGDEFSIVLEEPTTRANALQVANSLIQLLAAPIEAEGQFVQVGASIGIAVYPDDATSLEALCIAADRKMYSHKYGSQQPNLSEVPNPSLMATLVDEAVESNG